MLMRYDDTTEAVLFFALIHEIDRYAELEKSAVRPEVRAVYNANRQKLVSLVNQIDMELEKI